MLEKLNSSINASFIGRYFQMEERKTNFTTGKEKECTKIVIETR